MKRKAIHIYLTNEEFARIESIANKLGSSVPLTIKQLALSNADQNSLSPAMQEAIESILTRQNALFQAVRLGAVQSTAAATQSIESARETENKLDRLWNYVEEVAP